MRCERLSWSLPASLEEPQGAVWVGVKGEREREAGVVGKTRVTAGGLEHF